MKMQSRKAPTLLYWVGLLTLFLPLSAPAKQIVLQPDDLFRHVIFGDPALDPVLPDVAQLVSMTRYGLDKWMLDDARAVQDDIVEVIHQRWPNAFLEFNEHLLSGHTTAMAEALIFGRELVVDAVLHLHGEAPLLAYAGDKNAEAALQSQYLIAVPTWILNQAELFKSWLDTKGGIMVQGFVKINVPSEKQLDDLILAGLYHAAIATTHPQLVADMVLSMDLVAHISLIDDLLTAQQNKTDVVPTLAANVDLFDKLTIAAGTVVTDLKPHNLKEEALFRDVILGGGSLDGNFPELGKLVSLRRFGLDDQALEDTRLVHDQIVATIAATWPNAFEIFNELLLEGDETDRVRALILGKELAAQAAADIYKQSAFLQFASDGDAIKRLERIIHPIDPYFAPDPPTQLWIWLSTGGYRIPPGVLDLDIVYKAFLPDRLTHVLAHHAFIEISHPLDVATKVTDADTANYYSLVMDYVAAETLGTKFVATAAFNVSLLDRLAEVGGILITDL